MKILKHGTIALVRKKTMQFKCPKCSCIFSAADNEYTKEFDKNELYYHVACPECNTTCFKDEQTAQQDYIIMRNN